ncbi:hypothetical protein [Propylenella binzhouense]|uniref:Uncharacterized protein n=1 Tax=Propylenella binzhouense TaxID=2555902 RepID=A0A964WSH9_9HYPH|nr:hypothetical protein [Propylenella binzhouense]MYZ46987.1 hypothetical protein [Propylenella binzhouense]
MTSFLVDGVLVVALLLTSARVTAMYRELKRLRLYHADYERVFEQTREALGGLERAIHDVNGRSGETLAALAERIEEGRAVLGRLDGELRTARAEVARASGEWDAAAARILPGNA